jgi:8-oxo-dGTP pyrophosphatase MutT (NUDIX family)
MHPWKTLRSTPVIDDRWLRVTADRCELPSGLVLDPFYVVHDPEWAHVFALNHDGRVLVVRQYRYAANTTCLELPGGVVDTGEEPLAAAKRELAEETGYTSAEWQSMGSMFVNPARQTNRVHIFVARNIAATAKPQLDASEDIQCSLISVAEVQRAIESGEFSQALHIASFYRCVHLAGSGGAHC